MLHEVLAKNANQQDRPEDAPTAEAELEELRPPTWGELFRLKKRWGLGAAALLSVAALVGWQRRRSRKRKKASKAPATKKGLLVRLFAR